MDGGDSWQKLYVYLQLKSITGLGMRSADIEMKLQLGEDEIPRLDRDCSRSRLTNMDQSNCDITFSFPVYQDSTESLNLISDKPVIIKLVENRKLSSIHSEIEETEETVVVGQGCIDILGYFQKKRVSAILDTFIYPVHKSGEGYDTVRATFHLYTLLPLLKNLDYSHILFITLESLYNCTEEIGDDAEDLVAELVFYSQGIGPMAKPEVIEICSFTGFKRKIIMEQSTNLIWESARNVEKETDTSFGLYTDNNYLIVDKLFQQVLCPEGRALDFSTIDTANNEALVCNSVHRYVIIEKLRSILEEVFHFRLQELMLRIYRKGAPSDILLEGFIEPSVLLYPNVSFVRFVVILQPPAKTGPPKRRRTKKDSLTSGNIVYPTSFAILSFCFSKPITGEVQADGKSSISTVESVKFCKQVSKEATVTPSDLYKEMAYDSFDDWVTEVVDYIVTKNIRDIDDAKNFFCCQSQNGENRILELIALDFNKRFPTKTNIEFSNLMAIVYKELENRIYKIIMACSEKQLKDCRISGVETQQELSELMENLKLANELKDELLSNTISKELNQNYSKEIDYHFYMFLNNVENGHFADARKYIEKPAKERKIKEEYYVRVLDIYMQYMENRSEETNYNEALEHLLINLKNLSNVYPKDINCYILLYCLYKIFDYLPGMEYARWNFENLDSKLQSPLTDIPKSRWQLYLNYNITFQSKRSQDFYKTVQCFQNIGAYKFAEIIFDHIDGDEIVDIERYLQKTTLQILLNEVPSDANPREFRDLTPEMKTVLEHVNGHLLFVKEEIDLAQERYGNITELVEGVDSEPYALGLRRYGNYMASVGQYENAIKALKMLEEVKKSLIVSYELGRAYYKMDRLDEALECFKDSTRHNLFISDIWGYLALVHLKLGENYFALECWKYAKHLPNTVIGEEIIEELNKIDMHKVDLYVDRPY